MWFAASTRRGPAVDVKEADVRDAARRTAAPRPARSAPRPRSRAPARRSRAGAAAHRAAGAHRPRSGCRVGVHVRAGISTSATTPPVCADGEAELRASPKISCSRSRSAVRPVPRLFADGMKSGAGIRHANHAAVTEPFDVDVDPASVFTRVDPCSHGVLDQRQSVVGGQQNLQGRRVDVHRVLEAIGHAHLHQLEIRSNEAGAHARVVAAGS